MKARADCIQRLLTCCTHGGYVPIRATSVNLIPRLEIYVYDVWVRLCYEFRLGRTNPSDMVRNMIAELKGFFH
jgi:hypothetical protein